MDRPLRSRVRIALNGLVLIVGCLTGTAVAAVTAQQAHADTVPPPPSGWTTVFGDDFAGAAGSAPSSANWFYDIGSGFGTGEIEHTTSSTSNVYLDGNGHLVLKAANSGGTWTSGRIESTREDFQAPPGGELEMTASIEQPNPATGLGYWPETAYAKAFQIQVSNDNSTWTTIFSTTTGTGGTQTLNVSGSGRYIRMYGTTRATQYGYSIYEFQVYAS